MRRLASACWTAERGVRGGRQSPGGCRGIHPGRLCTYRASNPWGVLLRAAESPVLTLRVGENHSVRCREVWSTELWSFLGVWEAVSAKGFPRRNENGGITAVIGAGSA